MKKYFYLLSSLVTVSSGMLISVQPNRQPQQRPQQQHEYATTQPKAMITPAVAPRVRDGAGLMITADFIWWKTTIAEMEYATTGIVDGGTFVPLGSSTKRGHVNQPDFDFEPGFKIGAGLDFAYDGWDLYAQYTWLNGDTERNSVSAHRGNGAATLFPVVFENGRRRSRAIAKESSHWRQHFNVVDLELGRNFFISRRLTLRPHFGLKSAWITENWRLKLKQVPNLTEAIVRRKQTLWGIGTRGGLDTVWHFSRNWGLYADIAATALWSDFHVKAKDKTSTPQTTYVGNLNTKEVITKIIPILETGLGLTYMTWFNNDEYMLEFSAGWEEQVWLDFNNFVDFNRTGNLSVHGLTLKVGFAF